MNLLILYLLLVGVSFGVGAPAGAVLSALYRDNPAALLLPLALVWVLRMLLWFTPALVFLQGENPFRAMRLSARTVLGNVLPMTVLMTLQGALVAGAVAAVQWVQTAGAGRLAVAAAVLAAFVLFQVWNALCCYAAYRDVWFEQDAPPPPKVRQPVDDLPEQPQPIQKFCKNKASSRNRRGGGRRCRETA
uniref:Uncharacterized protein n=1 Tax=Conchiformibius kuhniae TaxID=211502 RepID=A0A8T9MUJ9_9NEIS|nr:hypothetical protein LVJ77_06915 [Conchiformibius kuhniae]